MKLNKKNWFARYYNWCRGEYPIDLCSFFWGSVLLVALSLFIFVGRLASDDRRWEKYDVRLQIIKGITFIFLACISLLFLDAVGLFVVHLYGYEFIYIWAKIMGGIGVGIITTILLIGIAFSIYFILKTVKIQSPVSKTHLVQNTVDFIGAIRRKYCVKITWK